MYVCLCHAVTDHAIRGAVERGVSTFRELSFNTGCGTQCGSCVQTARKILKDAVADRHQIALPVVSNPAFAA